MLCGAGAPHGRTHPQLHDRSAPHEEGRAGEQAVDHRRRAAHGGGVYTTIEGNTSGGVVARKTRYASQIVCGIAPYYNEEDIVTDKDKREIAQMAADMVMAKLSAKNANGVPKVAELVLGARNKSLESVDFYQIVRDIRNALGIQDGQKVTKTTATNVGWDRSVIAKIAAKLGVK